MATVRVTHGIGDLAADIARIPPEAVTRGSAVVRRNIKQGEAIAKRLARESSGPHGKNYFKRIGSDMLGALEGEFGPHGDVENNAVGAGWRNGPPNTDLPKAADIIGPKFAAGIGEMVDGLFW